MHMKKTKFAMLLVMVLVFALQSVGMMPAGAEGTSALALEDLTADALFEGLGDALNYGVVAEEYTQLNHAETSICVDTLYKNHADPFMNTDKTFEYGSSYTLYASVSAPADKSLKDMEFALFYMDGEDYVMFEDTLCKVSDDVNTTVLEWDITKDSPCLKKELCVRQVELIGGNYVLVPENGKNKADLTVKYGPDVSTAAPSSSYIGEVVSNQNAGNTGKFFNTSTPTGIEFGPGIRLVIEDGDEWKDVTDRTYKYVDKSGNSWGATVYFEYKDQLGLTRRTKFTDMRIYYEYDDVNGGYFYQVFEDGGEEYPVNFKKSDFVGETDENGKVKGRAQTLLEQAADFSVQLANLGGGTSVTNDINQDPSLMGNSTVTAGLDAKGRVVSVYSATITDNKIDFDASSEVLDTQIHIAENEYVVVNVVVDPSVSTVTLGAPPSPPYIIAAGQEDKATWYDGPDSGCSDRVLYNYVTKDADGNFQPYTGKIENTTQFYGGTMLAPGADIEVKGNVVNGSLIGKTVVNNGQELHQRTMTRPSQTTTVYMFGKNISENGALQLTKRNGSTKEMLAGVTFGVFETESSEQPLATGITDENGYLIINDLTPGKYCVKEISAPEGYDVSKAQVFKNVEIIAGVTTVLGLDNGGYVDNIKGYGQLKIVKVDTDDTSKMLEGAEFEIYYYNGDVFNADEAILVGTHSTNKNGVIEIPLDAGTYWVKEIKAPFGYELDSTPVKVTVVTDGVALVGANGVVTNEKMPTGTMAFTKVDADDETKKLQDAEFGIYADEACNELLKTFKTAYDGTVNLEMPVGTYYVKETKAPANYKLDDTVHTVVIEAGKTTKIGDEGVLTNEYGTGKLWLKKAAVENYRPKGLAGAWFGVYKDNVLVTTNVTNDEGYVEFEVPINNNQSGYVVKELYAPNGYVNENFTKGDLWITKAGESKQVEGNYWPGGEFNGAISNKKSNQTGKLTLFKNTWDLDPNGLPADGKDNRKNVVAIEGAVFGIYFDEACEMPIDGSPFTTNKDGRISVEGLTPGKYWLKELEPAPGYMLNSDKLSVDVKPGPGESRVSWKDSYGNEYRWVYNAVDNAVSATLDVTKYLDTGSYSALVKETFNFAMTFKSAKDAAGADKTTGYTINDGEEAIAFAGNSSETAKDAFKVSFTEPGVYTFEVKEIAGDNTDYIVYDKSVYTVVYNVTEQDGALSVQESISKGEATVLAVSFTNTYGEFNIEGKKVWSGADESYRLQVDKFAEKYLVLSTVDADGKLTKVTDYDIINSEGTANGAYLSVFMGSDGHFYWSFRHLPAYDADGNALTYVVKELTVNGYQTFYVNQSGEFEDETDGLYVKAPRPASTEYALAIHNILADATLRIDKTVEVQGNAQPDPLLEFQFTITPAEGLTGYHFMDAQGKELTSPVTIAVEKKADGEITGTLPVTILFDSFNGTEKKFTFIVKETGTAPAGWTYDDSEKTVTFTVMRNQSAFEPSDSLTMSQPVVVAMDSTSGGTASFTNTYKEVEKTDVVITKFWANETFASKDKVPNIADKLTLCKLVNGNPVKVENAPTPAHEATDADRSVYTWSGLPMYDENGNAIEYVVVEQKMPGYEQYYFGADGRLIDGGTYAPNGGAIDNEWQTTDVIITKVWVGVPPVDSDISNDLVLYANGKHVNEAPEKDGNRYAWYDLPEYDENGKLITYTVKESGIPGYVVSYEPLHVGEDADQEVAKDFAFAGETITNTYYETKGKVEFEGVKVLNGRDMKAGEFTFILTDKDGNALQSVTNAADGSFAFDAIEFTELDVPYGKKAEFTYYITELAGDLPGVTYDNTQYVIELLLTDNKAGQIIVETVGGSLPEIKFVNTYEEKVYVAEGEVEFDGVKVLNGRDMKAGEFTFILTDKAGKELQRVTNAADGTFAFEPIKYTEKDVPYGKDAEFTYYITELAGNLPGVTYDTTKYEIVVGLWDDAKGTIHVGDISECVNEIVFTNTYEAEGAVTFKGAKSLLGREFKQGDEFTFELLNEQGDVIDTVTINPTNGTKADFAFKTIKYELADAGKTYTYTYRVKEKNGNEEGMTYDDTVHTVTVKVSDAGNGTLKVEASKNADALNFTNTYLAEGTVLFSGTKTMNGKALEGKDFTFVLTDADGKEIETVINDKDGKIVFSAIQYKLEDAGKTFTYKVSEKNDGKKSVTYDDTVYTVTVKVEDAGNGHLKVTASDNATKLNFTNSYEAKAILTMNAYKTVNGYKPSVNQVYDFVLLCDDGTEMKAQNKDEVITFGTIGFDEEDVGKTFIYTVKETTEANELLEVDAAIYQVAVTVVDNGDGNLKLETEILKDGKRANGVVFANTATATLAISKTVKGPGPDKAFDLKVTFIGVDGKELEGVYDYDGDVKGTITSGGVIALKDGQSVTIVGLPEGATYTVEENAGPAYTVTVNGKPIAKAEGTLVGHGKLEFINTVEVTTFSVTKVWEGTDLGEITLTLYADGKQITPQPEVTREGNKYTYYNLPKYNEEGEEIVYSAKERGIDGYIRIYNNVEPYQDVTSFVHDGGTIINREVEEEVHELSFKIHKVWTGVEATEEIPAITLTLYCNGEKLDVPTPKPDSEGWYRYYDLPKTVNGQIAVYTVVEEPIPSYTVTYKTASGEVVEEGVNGGEIINAKIPQTGDPATLGLWLALMGASAVLLTMLQRRRKA